MSPGTTGVSPRRWAISLLISLALHATVLLSSTVVPVWPLLRMLKSPPASGSRPPLTLRSDIADQEHLAGELTVLSSFASEAENVVTFRPEEVFASALSVPEPDLELPPLAAPRLRWENMREVIEASVQQASALSEQEQLERLALLARRLEKVSSPQSLDDVTHRLSKWLGTQRRAPAGDGPPAGPFDFSTAQLHEVFQEPGPAGEPRYTAILVDAAGRQMATAMKPEDGARAYRVMQLLKQNPLAERVYRALVMGLLDRTLSTIPHAGPPLPDAAPAPDRPNEPEAEVQP